MAKVKVSADPIKEISASKQSVSSANEAAASNNSKRNDSGPPNDSAVGSVGKRAVSAFQNPLENIEDLQSHLWDAADNLRANSKLTANEYCMPVLGIIFLRHATNRYNDALKDIEAEQAAGRMPKRPLTAADFKKRRALMLPKEARYNELLQLPKGTDLGTALVDAMNAIERDFEPLQNQLPKDYTKFDNTLLEEMLRVFDGEALRNASGDVFGRINEYFLMKFAMQGAQDNGEFFTPPSLVQTIVNVIEPDHGIVFDPAAGSGGMFVQTSHFIEEHGENPAHKVTFYGHEYKTSNIRLAKMNLAVHALEGDIKEANTFYEDPHELFNKCDFVMANPPFNVDKVDAVKAAIDQRLPFGLPGVNKDKKVSNGNYLWISYFWSYLNENGRAGFVMSSQASSAGNKEAEVRRKIVETGDVDVIISIRPNFFYTRTVPCELWHFDRSKPADRRDKVLMIDARNIYRKVTRKIYDFSPEQLQNLSAIVWLYRGQSDRFIALVHQYLERTLAEAAAIAERSVVFSTAYKELTTACESFLKTLPNEPALRELMNERDEAAKACFDSLEKWNARIASDRKTPCAPKLEDQKKLLTEIEALATACRDLVKDVDLVFKLVTRLIQTAEKEASAKDHHEWDGRVIGKLEKELDARRKELIEPLKATAYFERQVNWLLSRFPEAELAPVPGLVKLVDKTDIELAEWSLTPGRYVGVAPAEVDEDFDFEQALSEIHVELAELNQEAAGLANQIQNNFEGLGI
jgi:type I restriction enzyme M protein